MLSSTTSPSPFTTLARDHQPNTNPTQTANDGSIDGSSTSATATHYAQLLGKFPATLHDELRHTLPEAEQLAAFHQGFIERECPLTEKSVTHELNAIRDHRIVLQEKNRIRYVTDYQRDHHLKSHDVYGATQLHHAILNEDIGLARALLSQSGVDHGAIIQPTMRLKDWTRIGYAVSSLPPSSKQETVHHAILGALKRRDTAGGRVGPAFASHNGDNPLTFALTRNASQSMIALLLDHYASHAPAMLSAPDANGVPPLLAAVDSGNEAAVRLLLKQPGVNINGVNRQRQNAVMTSIIAGNSKMLDLLLESCPDLDMLDAQGRTAQELAMTLDASDLYTKLVQAKLLAEKTTDGASRIHAQIVRDFRSAALAGKLAMVKAMLASCGAALDAKAIAAALGDAVGRRGNAAVVACLIDVSQTRIALNEVASRGLELAAADAQIFDVVARALYPANPAGVNQRQLQALMHCAATLGLTDWVVYGLEGGIDINDQDVGHLALGGSSVLMKSLAHGHDALSIELLSRKPSLLNDESGFDNSTLAIAGLHSPSPVQTQKNLSLIITHHPDLYRDPATAICLTRLAVSRNLPMLIDKLVADGELAPEAFDGDPQSLLMQVMKTGSRPLLAALLQPGAPVEPLLNASNGNVDAALAYAADHNDAESFNLLLNACHLSPTDKANVSLRRLALAAKVGSSAACRKLIDATAIVQPRTAARRLNPLMQAVMQQHHAVLAYLLTRGGHGCLKYKNTYKSAIEKALAMKDDKAVAIVLGYDQHLNTELPPVMDHLMSLAIDNADVLSFEHLTKAMLSYERSPKKLKQYAEKAIDIGCAAAVKLIIDPQAQRTLNAEVREELFRRALHSTRPNPDIVMHFLEVEGHPRSGTGGTDPYLNTLETGSSGAKRLVNALLIAGAPKEQKVFWMAAILCHTYLDTSFVSARDMSISMWGRLVAPLAKSMKGDAGFTAALSKAAEIGVLSGKPKAFCNILINYTAHILDVDIDLMPAAEAILSSKRLDLLDLLPDHIRSRLQAKYKTLLGTHYMH